MTQVFSRRPDLLKCQPSSEYVSAFWSLIGTAKPYLAKSSIWRIRDILSSRLGTNIFPSEAQLT